MLLLNIEKCLCTNALEFWCRHKTRFETYFSPKCYLIVVSKSEPVGVFIFIGKKIQRILLLCPPKFLDLPLFLNIFSVCLKLWNLNNFNVGVFEEVSTAGKSVRVRVSDTQRCVNATRSRLVTNSVHIYAHLICTLQSDLKDTL